MLADKEYVKMLKSREIVLVLYGEDADAAALGSRRQPGTTRLRSTSSSA